MLVKMAFTQDGVFNAERVNRSFEVPKGDFSISSEYQGTIPVRGEFWLVEVKGDGTVFPIKKGKEIIFSCILSPQRQVVIAKVDGQKFEYPYDRECNFHLHPTDQYSIINADSRTHCCNDGEWHVLSGQVAPFYSQMGENGSNVFFFKNQPTPILGYIHQQGNPKQLLCLSFFKPEDYRESDSIRDKDWGRSIGFVHVVDEEFINLYGDKLKNPLFQNDVVKQEAEKLLTRLYKKQAWEKDYLAHREERLGVKYARRDKFLADREKTQSSYMPSRGRRIYSKKEGLFHNSIVEVGLEDVIPVCEDYIYTEADSGEVDGDSFTTLIGKSASIDSAVLELLRDSIGVVVKEDEQIDFLKALRQFIKVSALIKKFEEEVEEIFYFDIDEIILRPTPHELLRAEIREYVAIDPGFEICPYDEVAMKFARKLARTFGAGIKERNPEKFLTALEEKLIII